MPTIAPGARHFSPELAFWGALAKILAVKLQTSMRGKGGWFAVGVAFGLSFALGRSALPLASADTPQRYPYDPACAWGRLADGHGMLIRCLDPKEASQLLQASLEAEPAKAATPKATGGDAEQGKSPGRVSVTKVGPAVADTGELPLAAKQLSGARDRFVECVKKHGGLTEPKGRVVVRFLVRERGRAEGVGVKSFHGMSEQAAKCIAEVVDRRYVGYPAAPMVGATLPIELSPVGPSR